MISHVEDKHEIAQHDAYMREALTLADRAQAEGEVPVGALCVADDQVIGRGWNRSIQNHDPSAHAEIIALREAARVRANYRLPGTTLYVTLEPCAMCLGAILHARVEHLVFAASDPKTGAVGGVFDLREFSLPTRLTVTKGIMATDASEKLRMFFRAKRQAAE